MVSYITFREWVEEDDSVKAVVRVEEIEVED